MYGWVGGWEHHSSTENGMCRDTGAGYSHHQNIGYISTLFIPSFIQQIFLLSTFYENNTARDIQHVILCSISCQFMAECQISCTDGLWYRNIEETQFCLSCSLTPHLVHGGWSWVATEVIIAYIISSADWSTLRPYRVLQANHEEPDVDECLSMKLS